MNQATESNNIFLAAWDAMSAGNPEADSLRGGLIEFSWSGLPAMFFNMGVVSRRPESIAEFASAVKDACEWTGPKGLPWILCVCHETVGDMQAEIGTVLAEHGIVPMMPLTGMEADTLTASSRPRPDGAWMTESDGVCGRTVLDINEAAYQMQLGAPGSLPMEQAGWWSAPLRMASVLTVASKPVSCAGVVNVNGLRYVALVATHPEAQRKGYADVVMRDVLERSLKAGLNQRTYLHATAAGRPVYERMGYRATAEYTAYMKIAQ